jgi:hypoxanthine phosphoribosyltransferase
MSNQPLDRLNLLIDDSHLRQAVLEMAQRIDADFPESKEGQDLEPVMVVVLKGGFIFAADLLTFIKRPIPVIFVTPRLAEWSTMMSPQDQEMIKGRDLIVVDLLLDSGASQKRLCETLQSHEPASIHLAILLHKTVEKSEELVVDYLGFEVPDVRLVGYGLDEDQRYRGLAGIYTWWTPPNH